MSLRKGQQNYGSRCWFVSLYSMTEYLTSDGNYGLYRSIDCLTVNWLEMEL